jgi:plasmid replication initiation protein
MSIINNRNIVKTSHELNHFRGGYTPTELDFIYSFISTIKKEDEEFKDYSLTLKELEAKLGKRLQLSKIEYIFDSLVRKSFKVNNEKELTVYSFFSMLQYKKETKTLTVSFNEKLKPHLLQLQTYAMGNLKYILQFRGEYSKRMYMLLSQWRRAGEVIYSVDELREMLAIPESYLYGDIKQKVLLKSQLEFKKKANFYFEFEVIKEGRKVVSIKFDLVANNRELETFIDEIREEYADQRLFAINTNMLHSNEEGKLYYFDNNGERKYLEKNYEKKCWKELLKNKDKLAIFVPNLLQLNI